MDEEKIATQADEGKDPPLTKSGFTHFIEKIKSVLGKYQKTDEPIIAPTIKNGSGTKNSCNLTSYDDILIGKIFSLSGSIKRLQISSVSGTPLILTAATEQFADPSYVQAFQRATSLTLRQDGTAHFNVHTADSISGIKEVYLTGIADPTEDTGAANKKYVDNKYVSLQINLTEHELNAIAQGQAMTDLELMILEGK